jgi:ankyrin repeat protein
MPTRGAAARERLLRVGTCLAQCGYGAQVAQLAACARALRADAQLWAAQARHRGRSGRTALMRAADMGDLPRIIFLLEHGADVEAVEARFGDTPLMLACVSGRCDAARLLVERGGASVNTARTSDGMSALMFASQRDRLDTARFLVELGGASVNARTTAGATALMIASENGCLEIVRLLVELEGANVNAASLADGMTALMVASGKGHLEIARLLVERGGADATAARTTDGMTALIFASIGGHLETARLLLLRGADRHARANSGWSAFNYAKGYSRNLLLHELLRD